MKLRAWQSEFGGTGLKTRNYSVGPCREGHPECLAYFWVWRPAWGNTDATQTRSGPYVVRDRVGWRLRAEVVGAQPGVSGPLGISSERHAPEAQQSLRNLSISYLVPRTSVLG
jgi:hypothetical protein